MTVYSYLSDGTLEPKEKDSEDQGYDPEDEIPGWEWRTSTPREWTG